jgi:NAD(P)-dependent dehydrogenase (short-subunit alcohol dehydrogenase family)
MARTIIVTGGSRGIGRAATLRLLQDGHNVVVNYHANERNAQETLDLAQGAEDRVIAVKADVAKAGDVDRLMAETVDRFGAIDVLINNASINIDRSLLDMTEDDWDRVVDSNMKSVFLASKAAARVMLDQADGGHIINLGALTAIHGRANGLNYCASKAGVLVMTKCLAIELAPRVRVNCVIPGTIRTPELDERFDLANNEPAMAEKLLLKRIGEPEDVAGAISFLVSSDGRYINGQKLIVDGGSFLY